MLKHICSLGGLRLKFYAPLVLALTAETNVLAGGIKLEAYTTTVHGTYPHHFNQWHGVLFAIKFRQNLT
jgi:hypothetical protein